jgi:hypothetical protein
MGDAGSAHGAMTGAVGEHGGGPGSNTGHTPAYHEAPGAGASMMAGLAARRMSRAPARRAGRAPDEVVRRHAALHGPAPLGTAVNPPDAAWARRAPRPWAVPSTEVGRHHA